MTRMTGPDCVAIMCIYFISTHAWNDYDDGPDFAVITCNLINITTHARAQNEQLPVSTINT